jgi:glucose-1-phosphate cytidylyltransferase
MQIIAVSGSTEFVVALGHLSHVIKDFFLRFEAYAGDFRIRLGDGTRRWLTEPPEADWQVTCVDTGEDAGTGSRLREAARHVSGWPILVAYGDVLADVDVSALIRYHRGHGRLATVTAVRPPSRYGVLMMDHDHRVVRFDEKAPTGAAWVSAGYFVLERAAVEDYIPISREVMFEEEPVRRLVEEGQLAAYAHDGYWQPVDTLKDLHAARAQWDSGEAPWRTWKS